MLKRRIDEHGDHEEPPPPPPQTARNESLQDDDDDDNKPFSPPPAVSRPPSSRPQRDTKPVAPFKAGPAPPPRVAHKIAKFYDGLPSEASDFLIPDGSLAPLPVTSVEEAALQPPSSLHPLHTGPSQNNAPMPSPKATRVPLMSSPLPSQSAPQQAAEPLATESRVSTLEQQLQMSRERNKARLEKVIEMQEHAASMRRQLDAATQQAASLEQALETARSQLRSFVGEPEALERIDDVEQLEQMQSVMIQGLARLNAHRGRLLAAKCPQLFATGEP